MKKLLGLLMTGLFALSLGCSKPDPRDRPGFVDTSDPSKTIGTMDKLPKAKDTTSLGGAKK